MIDWSDKGSFLSFRQVMQETAELKNRLERERTDLECRLRQQVDQHQERACDLDKQVWASFSLENHLQVLVNPWLCKVPKFLILS